ncbi:unnamed protein product, partial [Closterium sp. NIES-65]
MTVITSASGLLAMLDEEEPALRVYALKNLNLLVGQFWAEISANISTIANELQPFLSYACMGSPVQVFYYLGELTDSLTYALGAGSLFDVSEDSEYVQTLIGACVGAWANGRMAKCIDEYMDLSVKRADSHDPDADYPLDPRLVAIVERMLDNCIEERQFQQAIGVALECRRLDKLEAAVARSGNSRSLLAYCLQVSHSLVNRRQFRQQVLHPTLAFSCSPSPSHHPLPRPLFTLSLALSSPSPSPSHHPLPRPLFTLPAPLITLPAPSLHPATCAVHTGAAAPASRDPRLRQHMPDAHVPQRLPPLLTPCPSPLFIPQVLSTLVRLYQQAETPDYGSICQMLMFLSDAAGVAATLDRLIKGQNESDALLAYQVAFDLFENEFQQFLLSTEEGKEGEGAAKAEGGEATDTATAAAEDGAAKPAAEVDGTSTMDTTEAAGSGSAEAAGSGEGEAAAEVAPSEEVVYAERLAKLKGILTGETPIGLTLQFLYSHNKADLGVLKAIKQMVESRNSVADLGVLKAIKQVVETRNSVCHSATIVANAFMHAGTTVDTFLRDNLVSMRLAELSDQLGEAECHSRPGGLVEPGDQLGEAERHSRAGGDPQGPPAAGALPHGPLPAPRAGGSAGAAGGLSGSAYSEGGALYALGLIHANHGESIKGFLLESLRNTSNETIQHGACLGVGLAAMGTGDEEVYEDVKSVLYTDSAVAGEAAGIAMGLLLVGTASERAAEMLAYAHDTQHEKIIRGLAVGISLVVYGREEEADILIQQMTTDADPILRYGGMYAIAMAYRGTANNGAIRQLLHFAVSDVSDDVRRAAVLCLGFVLCAEPDQVRARERKVMVREVAVCVSLSRCCAVPGLCSLCGAGSGEREAVREARYILSLPLSLLCCAVLRYAAAMAVGIACTGTAQRSALDLLEPLPHSALASPCTAHSSCVPCLTTPSPLTPLFAALPPPLAGTPHGVPPSRVLQPPRALRGSHGSRHRMRRSPRLTLVPLSTPLSPSFFVGPSHGLSPSQSFNPHVRYGAAMAVGIACAGTAQRSALNLLEPLPHPVPRMVSLLAESFNPHVRYGAAMAVGIACAGTAQRSALDLLEPLTSDGVDFVRQGAVMATAMVLMQCSQEREPRVVPFRRQLEKAIHDKHEDTMCKMGAILASGILDAGGRNVTISLRSRSGYDRVTAVIGMALFTQYWYWFPLLHFLSLSFSATALVGLQGDLKAPKFDFVSECRPGLFAYPPPAVVASSSTAVKAPVAVLSTAARAKGRAKEKEEKKEKEEEKKDGGEGKAGEGGAMDGVKGGEEDGGKKGEEKKEGDAME